MYENFGYLLLGLIVQNASGMPFAEYMETEIFAPLGMSKNGLYRKDICGTDGEGYGADQQPVDFYLLKPTVMPHGGMLSTAEDMTRFMIAMLSGGTAENGETLSSESRWRKCSHTAPMDPLCRTRLTDLNLLSRSRRPAPVTRS